VDDPGLKALLETYFPEAVRAAVGEDLAPRHRLAGHIAVTVLVNQAVDLMGGAGFLGLLRDTHRDAARVVKAWHVAWLAGRAHRIVEGIHALDLQVSAGVQARWLLRLSASLERATRWLLANADLSRPIDELADFYAEPVGVLCDSLLDMVADAKRAELQNRIVLFTTDGLPEDRALDLVALESLAELLPVVQLAREGGFDASRVGGIYYGLAGVIDFPWLQERLSAPRGDDRWDQRAAQALALDLEASRTRVVGRILERMGPDTPVCEALSEFGSSFGEGVELVRAVVDELRGEGPLGLAGLMVAVQEISTQVNAWSEGADGS
jgi:NAD-specific glutamate dehydrogenase